MEYQIKIEDRDIKIEKNREEILIDGTVGTCTIEKHDERYYLYTPTKVHTVQIVEKKDDTLTLLINRKIVEVKIQDHIALMLEKLGMDNTTETVINQVKAPMPGVIMSILVEEGQEIKKGEPLLILEAMKMENMIKSPTDGMIQSISIVKGQSVEKNEPLISFD